MALLDGADELEPPPVALSLALLAALPALSAASAAVSSAPQALSVMAVLEAAASTRVRVRVRFTGISLFVVRGFLALDPGGRGRVYGRRPRRVLGVRSR
jgi:hypothetical protein